MMQAAQAEADSKTRIDIIERGIKKECPVRPEWKEEFDGLTDMAILHAKRTEEFRDEMKEFQKDLITRREALWERIEKEAKMKGDCTYDVAGKRIVLLNDEE